MPGRSATGGCVLVYGELLAVLLAKRRKSCQWLVGWMSEHMFDLSGGQERSGFKDVGRLM